MHRREVTKEDLKWRVRFTWEPLNGLQHPKYTYSEAESEDRAIDMAVAAYDRHKGNKELRLVEVHRKHVDAELWLKVE